MMNQTATLVLTDTHVEQTDRRVKAIDMERGLIMCLMALSHCQEYICIGRKGNFYWKDPVWQSTSLFEFLGHAFISLVASGGFFFMMGMGLVFLWRSRLREGWSPGKIMRYLITRGLLLITVQFTILQLFECVTEQKIFVYAGVLCSLGVCMMAAAVVLFTTEKLSRIEFFARMKIYYVVPLLFVIAIPWFVHVETMALVSAGAQPSTWQTFFLLGGRYNLSGLSININFTPLPWFTAVAFGLIMGRFVATNREKSWRVFGYLSALFLGAWFLLRLAINAGWFTFGDYKPSFIGAELTLSSLFSVSKYPPGICYYLWSLGINLGGIFLFHKAERSWPYLVKLLEPLQFFGKSALFFFVTHWFVYFGLSLFIPYKLFDVWSILGVWLIGLLMLNMMCRAFYEFKIKKAKASVWRMF